MTELDKLYNRQRRYARLRNKIFDSWWRYTIYKLGFLSDFMFRLNYKIDLTEMEIYEVRRDTLFAHIPKDGLIMAEPMTKLEKNK